MTFTEPAPFILRSLTSRHAAANCRNRPALQLALSSGVAHEKASILSVQGRADRAVSRRHAFRSGHGRSAACKCTCRTGGKCNSGRHQNSRRTLAQASSSRKPAIRQLEPAASSGWFTLATATAWRQLAPSTAAAAPLLPASLRRIGILSRSWTGCAGLSLLHRATALLSPVRQRACTLVLRPLSLLPGLGQHLPALQWAAPSVPVALRLNLFPARKWKKAGDGHRRPFVFLVRKT